MVAGLKAMLGLCDVPSHTTEHRVGGFHRPATRIFSQVPSAEEGEGVVGKRGKDLAGFGHSHRPFYHWIIRYLT